MLHIELRVSTRVQGCVVAMVSALAMACREPTSVTDTSSFSAEVTGARNERLTGSAMVSSGSAWARESVVQVTLPNVGTFSGIVLSGSDLMSTISLIRSGTELPAGTHRIGRIPTTTPVTTPMFTAGYVIRDGDRLQIFMADSGSLTITETGQRVTGSFAIYANRYDVIKAPTRDQVGQVITPIASGTAPVRVSGTFDAGRRR